MRNNFCSTVASHDPNFGPVTKIEGKFKKFEPKNHLMDILDPLVEGETIEVKEVIDEIHIKEGIMDSDEDGNVDHLSPQTLLETSEQEVQYAVRPQEGNMITYRVVHVDDSTVEATVPQIVTTGATGYSNASSMPQVLTSNINGQLYVIGNAAEVFGTQTGTRAIAPRSSITDSIIESNSSIVTSIKKRDERRRATHNEVERRRRDKINNWITKLATIIPESPNEIKGSGHYDGQSKGGILAKACDYITDLKHVHEKYENLLKEHKDALERLEYQHQKNLELEKDNKLLKALLKKHSILVIPDENKSS